jgi:hypothetical protein
VQKKRNKDLPKWIWQQTNEITLGKTNSCRNTHFTKHTLVKSHTCKRKKIVNKWWKLKPNTLFLQWKKKDNIHIMLYLYGTKDLTSTLHLILNLTLNLFQLCMDFK